MKNVIKNIVKTVLLALGIVCATNNLAAMIKSQATLAVPAQAVPAKTETKAPALALTDKFLDVCMSGDLAKITEYFVTTSSITETEIWRVHRLISNERAQNFLGTVCNIFYQNKNLGEITEFIKSLKNGTSFTAKDRFAFVNFMPHIFELAALRGLAHLVDHLLQNYNLMITNKYLNSVFSKVSQKIDLQDLLQPIVDLIQFEITDRETKAALQELDKEDDGKQEKIIIAAPKPTPVYDVPADDEQTYVPTDVEEAVPAQDRLDSEEELLMKKLLAEGEAEADAALLQSQKAAAEKLGLI